ncbi:MAG TPA: EcsC family protein [Anaeromyxobacteraceae bacterium]|nr:EcsC family protein [Anaeromyxobacteraceae bacterium]
MASPDPPPGLSPGGPFPPPPGPALSTEEARDLHRARAILEHPGFLLRLAGLVPVEGLLRRLPERARRAVGDATRAALDRALDLALRTLDFGRGGPASDWLHRGVVAASGALGGAAGLAGLALELPFSLTVMLRSIADHARAEGEDLSGVAARLECLAVLAYGSNSPGQGSESAYLASRLSLGQAVVRASAFIAERGVAEALGEQGAPALAQLVSRIAQRLSATVADKAAAQLVPVVGAVGGAALNTLFLRHYQEAAWAHFTVRRLERIHGAEAVEAAYRAAPGVLRP